MMTERALPAFATPASRYRLVLARELAASFPPELGIEIALTGSVARGVADSFSDIELNFWTRRVPETGAWLPWLQEIGAVVPEPAGPLFRDDGWLWTGCSYRGIWVELGWHAIDDFDGLVNRLVLGEERAMRRLQMGWIIGGAVPLRSEGHLRRWKERLHHYPDTLQRTIIADNTEAWSDPHVAPVRWALAARGQRMGLATRLVWDVTNVLQVLWAVNRRWPQDWKWTDGRSLDLAVAPQDLARRIDAIFALDDVMASVRACFALILDTLDLVPTEIDVSAARSNLRAALAAEPRVTRACAAVIRGDAILMVECRHATHNHWTLPGGRVDEGETPEEAALRELAEEAGLQGDAATMLYIRPWGRETREGLEACFLVEVSAAAEPILGGDPEADKESQTLVSLAWRPLAELAEDIQVSKVVESLLPRHVDRDDPFRHGGAVQELDHP